MFNCQTYRVPWEQRSIAFFSLFPSHAKQDFVLRSYREVGEHQIGIIEHSKGSLDEIALAFRSIKNMNGDILDVLIRKPRKKDGKYAPIYEVNGEPRIISVGLNYLNFDQPAVWGSAYAAEHHEEAFPSLNAEEQQRFIHAILPYAKHRN